MRHNRQNPKARRPSSANRQSRLLSKESLSNSLEGITTRALATLEAGPTRMKLICPSCQKELTVPDQYAGQVMKCPLCAGNFTAPTLPQAPDASPPVSAAPAHTYGLAPEPIVPVTAPVPSQEPAPPRKTEP